MGSASNLYRESEKLKKIEERGDKKQKKILYNIIPIISKMFLKKYTKIK
jgi:hypothetical protein